MAMMTEMRTQGISLRRFIGKDVLDTQRQKIAEVDDVILNTSSGCAMFAIIDEGGFLGMGERHHVVPWDAFAWTSEGRLTVPFDRDKLTAAPVFDRSNPPDWGNETWQRSIYDFYGLPYKGMTATTMRSSTSSTGTMSGSSTSGTMGGGSMGGGSTGGGA